MAKYSAAFRISIAKEYAESGESCAEFAKRTGLPERTLRDWAAKYSAAGEARLKGRGPTVAERWGRKEPAQSAAAIRLKACMDCMSGGMTEEETAEKYGVPPATIRAWLSSYEELKDKFLKDSLKRKKKDKKISVAKKLEAVTWCLRNDRNYAACAEFFGVTYNRIYFWVRKYEQEGEDGLKDGRGGRKRSESEEIQHLRAKVKALEDELFLLKNLWREKAEQERNISAGESQSIENGPAEAEPSHR